jgi:HK97 family phage prohead protease
MIQHKSFDLDFKASDDPGGFSAYVARFGNLDRADEVIEPGAFRNLDDFLGSGWIGVNHDMKSLPVAYVDHAEQDSHGLLVTAKWHGTPDAQACRMIVNERLAAGKAVKCSIGYRVLDSVKDRHQGKSITRLKSLDLFEASIVNLPANPAAAVIMAKSLDPDRFTLDDLDGWLEARFKAGRVLSRANHSYLKGLHEDLSSACSKVKDLIDKHDPDTTSGMDDDDGGAGMGMPPMKSADELRAALLRARLKMLHPSV